MAYKLKCKYEMHMTKVTKVRVESEGGDETTNRRLSLVMVLRCQPPPKENKEDEEMLLISDSLFFGPMGYSDPFQKLLWQIHSKLQGVQSIPVTGVSDGMAEVQIRS